MPSAAWLWSGICLWTVGLALVAGGMLGALRSIAASLERMADRMEEVE